MDPDKAKGKAKARLNRKRASTPTYGPPPDRKTAQLRRDFSLCIFSAFYHGLERSCRFEKTIKNVIEK